MKITVIAGNGIGGTEKAAYLFAAELARRGHQVEALTDSANHRLEDLTNAGVTPRNVSCDATGLLAYFKDSRPDVVHHHVSGYGDYRFLYQAMDAMGAERPKLIETNVFGRLMDRHDAGHVGMRLFVSMASGCQAFSRPMVGKQTPSIARHGVLYNPLPHPRKEPAGAAGFRETLGLSPADFVLVRVGRPGHKWTNWECEAFQKARRAVPNLKLVLMEPTAELRASIRRGVYGEGIVVLNATSDQEFIDRLYQSSDAMLHASGFGESYGYTLAEGMRAGLPVITRTTPWADNAQVELVKQGESGFVCCSVSGMARAVVECATSSGTREAMSAAARRRVTELSDLSKETDLLEEILDHVTAGTCGPLMKERFSRWMAYRDAGFPRAEWRVFENDLGMHRTVIRSKASAACRQFRISVTKAVSRLRSTLSK